MLDFLDTPPVCLGDLPGYFCSYIMFSEVSRFSTALMQTMYTQMYLLPTKVYCGPFSMERHNGQKS